MEAFAINPIWIISYTVIFFLLYYFSRKFVYKVLATTEERKMTIEQGLKNAKEAEVLKADKIKEGDVEKQKVLQEAYQHAKEIIQNAKSKEEKIVEEANRTAEALVLQAKAELNTLKEKSQQEGLKEAKDIITIAIKKSFEGFEVDKGTEEKLIEKSLGKLMS